MTGPGRPHDPAAPRSGAPLPVLFASIAIVLALAWAHRAHVVDDAFIGLRFLENLKRGHGFVFSPGDAPVEGVTNIGWTLLLLPLSVLMPGIAAAKIAGAFALITGLALLARTLPEDGRAGILAGGAPLLLVATSFDIVYFAAAGMESGLLFAIVAAMALAAKRDANPLALGALGAAAFAVRPEAGAILAIHAALRRDRAAVASLATALVLIAAMTALRMVVFGDWLPQPARAKGTSALVMLANLREIATGSRAHLPFPIVGAPALALAWLGWRRWRMIAAPVADITAATAATGVLFALYALPDWTELARYAAPYAPSLIALAWLGLPSLIGSSRAAALGALALLLLVAAIDQVAKTARADRYPGYVVFGERLVEPARWIAANVPRDATIATRRIGAVGLHGDRRVFDYAVGLVDRDVTRLFAAPERGIEDPNDARLAALWKRRRPTHLLEDDDVIDRIASTAGGTRESFAIHGETFRVVKAFALGPQRQWLLAERLAR
ncbi:MAG: hypothetical protein FJX57_14320 [Alphaproteobacteria bacterium]|nr:hypothetical protein [Alphaproteobacteria bacterium]